MSAATASSDGMTVGAAEAPAWRGKGLALGVALAITALDLWSKQAVFAKLGDGEHLPLAGRWLMFTPVLNPGIMWGALPALNGVLPWMRVVAGLVVLWMIRSTPKRSLWTLLSLGLVLGGAAGNVWDGFSIGMVRDFILVDLDIPVFDPFPVFNVADSGITVGVALLALGMLREREPAR